VTEKERRLADFCKKRGYDGVLLRRRSNIAWLTDGADVHCDAATALGVATLLWTPRRKVVFTDEIEARRLAEEEFRGGWEIRAARWWDSMKFPEGRHATDWPRDAIAELRFPLTPGEVNRLRALGAECEESVARTLKTARRGWSEHEVAADLAANLRRRGIFPHVLLVAADERVDKYRHPIPTEKRVERKVMISLCGQRRGLIACLTRLAHFGRIAPDLRRRHDSVCRVDTTLQAATRPGRRWCDILAEGIRAYCETGFPDEWTKHHQGGPMGYESRDFKATPTEKRRVVPRQAVGWNPSITGTKSEDTILSSGEVLTAARHWPMCGGRPDILSRA
jgi:antitoxin VapB